MRDIEKRYSLKKDKYGWHTLDHQSGEVSNSFFPNKKKALAALEIMNQKAWDATPKQ